MKSYLKTFLFVIIVLTTLWYISNPLNALDYVKRPEIVIAIGVLIITILMNGKIVKDLHETRFEKLSKEEKEKYETQNDWLSAA